MMPIAAMRLRSNAGGGGGGGPTWDAVKAAATTGVTLSGANLVYTKTAGGDTITSAIANSFQTSGKFYFEVTHTNISTQSDVGMGNASVDLHTNAPIDSMNGKYVVARTNGQFFADGGTFLTLDSGYICSNGDVIGVSIDFATGIIAFRRNGGAFTQSFTYFTPGAALAPLGVSENLGGVLTFNPAPGSPPSGYGPWT